MLDIKEICILAAVGALVAASGLHIKAESDSLAELRHENEQAGLWAVGQRYDSREERDESVTLRIVDDQMLEERTQNAVELRNQITSSYSKLSARGKTLESIVGEPVAPQPDEWHNRAEAAKFTQW